MLPIIPILSDKEIKRKQSKGRQLNPVALQEVRDLLGAASLQQDLLIQHLHTINDHFGYLSLPHLAALAHELRLAQTEVFEVASFYHHFTIVKEQTELPAEISLRVCDGLSCEMAGAAHLRGQLHNYFQKTNNQSIRLIRVPCVGRCEQAPAAFLGQHAIPSADLLAINLAIAQKNVRAEALEYIDYQAYQAQGGYQELQKCQNGRVDRESLFKCMEESGLRGLGGAGFPVARKWRIVAAEVGPRLLAVNLDEGEPGTFKDRYYLERDPHRFLEGMLIAAWAVDIAEVYIYLRDEYHACRRMLEVELVKLQKNPPVAGMPSIHLRRGAGAYICGEESAMIASIEGKRGLPRLRPPYVAQVGLFNRPTLVHNFETLYWVPDLLKKGGDWFSKEGRNGRSGLRSFSVSGRVNQPGVYLAPAGISVAELIEEYCGGMPDGHILYAYLPGGASGGILPASLSHLPLDFDTLQAYGCFIGSAAIIVLSQYDSAITAARNMMAFFKHESCGQCTPCRAGTAKALDLISQDVWDIPLLQDLSELMRDASICGLGQAAPNPIDCVIKYFPQELDLAQE
ncbi:NADH-ubiquinone oxidoreductase-F iron-sulfur binding region domain-containing protein [Undibacterium sp.]|uniref:NADH-ubiquinone oxidoreductase-F iron-sulfur binding region domain-containing protein n=1 Tax=Undibacterium sp. TaxID=1914977 RepID=UPI0025F97FB9|nr:NADH-ubiquinone oxidoreductase-F iron-sulfur binding region domain-containing protein [Undibacterium sp.]